MNSVKASGRTTPAVRRTPSTSSLASRVLLAPSLTFMLTMTAPPAHAAVEQTFETKCAGCHMAGGNVVGGPTLFPGDLKANGLETSEALYNIIYNGKNKMPGFGTDCAPKLKCTFGTRFSDEEVKEMADYVLKRAGENWAK